MTISEVQKAAEAHDGVSNDAGNLVDHQMVDFADLAPDRIEDGRAFDPLARYEIELRVRVAMDKLLLIIAIAS
jgi:hypothetical protein